MSHDIVFKFEAFTLAVREPEIVLADLRRQQPKRRAMHDQLARGRFDMPALPPVPDEIGPDGLARWPLRNWSVAVVWVRDWRIPMELLPDDWYDCAEAARFAAVPPGAEDACLIAHALLFTGDGGERVLVGQGEMPLDLDVAQDDAAIDAALLQSWVMPLGDYLAGDLPRW